MTINHDIGDHDVPDFNLTKAEAEAVHLALLDYHNMLTSLRLGIDPKRDAEDIRLAGRASRSLTAFVVNGS